jgi:hypothetical protein
LDSDTSISLPQDRKFDRIGSANWKTDKYEDHSYVNRLQNYDQKDNYVDYNNKWEKRNILMGRRNANRGQSEPRADYWKDTSDAVESPYDYQLRDRHDYSQYDRYDLPSLDRSDYMLADRLDAAGGSRKEPVFSLPGYTSLLAASLAVKEQNPKPEKKG